MSDFLGSIIGGIGNLFGASMSSDAAKEAAKITGQYNLQATNRILEENAKAREEMRAAADRGLGYIDTGTGKYETTIAPLLEARPITMPAYRGLTEQQQLGREDLQRQGRAALASSGLRGAGRAGVAALLDADRRYILAARGANDADTITERRSAQGKADAARAGLASIYPTTGIAKSNTEIQTGTQIGNSLSNAGTQAAALTANTGKAFADAANQSGQAWGNFATNTANLVGQGVGNYLANNNTQSPNAGGGYVDYQGVWDTAA